MSSSYFRYFYLSLPFLLLFPSLPTTAQLPKRSNLLMTGETKPVKEDNTSPTLFFEVSKPIEVPKTKPCIHQILGHHFASTYGKPAVTAKYTPPSNCTSQKFSKIVLEWNATCKGKQFDRIFGVWLGGVELLRSCTAEPRASGIFWTVRKDVTRYHSSLVKNSTQNLTVYLGNIIQGTNTGVYHANITLYFYPTGKKLKLPESDSGNLTTLYSSVPDLILPISRNPPLSDGLWFEIESSTDVEKKEFKIPRNVYRAVLEVYVSFHENDEFWYANRPNEYVSVNNLTDYPGNGPFREVVISLDGNPVAVVWPFTVVYTGGMNPLLWRPITAIGSFDLPSYDVEITPFLGHLLDGKTHKVGFGVTNALNVWYVDANLHLWVDGKTRSTQAKRLNYRITPLVVSLVSDFKGLNGTFLTNASRSVSSVGWVNSSYGNITTLFTQDLNYSNSMVIGKNGALQIVNQTIHFDDGIYASTTSSTSYSMKSRKRFLCAFSDDQNGGDDTYVSTANITLGFNDEKIERENGNFSCGSSSVENLQTGEGFLNVKKNLLVSGVASTRQSYKFHSGNFCYMRNINSSNYTIQYDIVGSACN